MIEAPDKVAECPPLGQGLTPSIIGYAHCHRLICSPCSENSSLKIEYLKKTLIPSSDSIPNAYFLQNILAENTNGWRLIKDNLLRRIETRFRPFCKF